MENAWAEAAAKQIQESIDFEIVGELLVQVGWHRFSVEFTQEKQAYKWCEENCAGNWKKLPPCILIEKEEDAIMFKLKWM
jgi:hypothetical protein